MTKPRTRTQIRRGGVQTPGGYLYELSGGGLCLDFANTVDSRPTEKRRELLPEYASLIEWSLQAGALTHAMAKALRATATQDTRLATTTLAQAHALREAVFEVFSATASAASPPPAPLEVLNEYLPEAFGRLRLTSDGHAYHLELRQENSLDRPLWQVVRSAADLLISDRFDRVRECAAEDCSWLFLDQSRNRSRRWCDMTVCGNRSKVRRFRVGHQASSSKAKTS